MYSVPHGLQAYPYLYWSHQMVFDTSIVGHGISELLLSHNPHLIGPLSQFDDVSLQKSVCDANFTLKEWRCTRKGVVSCAIFLLKKVWGQSDYSSSRLPETLLGTQIPGEIIRIR